jgi:DNA invertase Pin-like site-specific DNA recombinase
VKRLPCCLFGAKTLDAVVCRRVDRLGRNLRHLVVLLEDLQALGVTFVSLNEGIDARTPAGRLQMAVLGAIAHYVELVIVLSR